jgi:hypothetical protein
MIEPAVNDSAIEDPILTRVFLFNQSDKPSKRSGIVTSRDEKWEILRLFLRYRRDRIAGFNDSALAIAFKPVW